MVQKEVQAHTHCAENHHQHEQTEQSVAADRDHVYPQWYSSEIEAAL